MKLPLYTYKCPYCAAHIHLNIAPSEPPTCEHYGKPKASPNVMVLVKLGKPS